MANDHVEEAAHNANDTYLTFEVDGSQYAASVGHVTELLRHQRCAGPDGPNDTRRSLKYRGQLIPLLDMSSQASCGGGGFIVVLQAANARAGLVVDAVSDVAYIAESHLQPTESTSLVRAVANREGRDTFILDVPFLLSVDVTAPTMASAHNPTACFE